MSWQLVAILFAVSALEGVRRVGPEELILRCNPVGVWSVASPIRLWRDWHLVSILAPFYLTITLPPGGEADAPDQGSPGIRQFARSIEPILALRLLGALDFLAIVFGIPWAVSTHGSAGLCYFLGFALAVSVAIALRSTAFYLREGPRKGLLRRAVSLLSPFASPLAAESVLSARTRRGSRATMISGLLSDTRFRALVRRSAYDVKSQAPVVRGSWLEEIALSLSGNERARILESASEGCTELERYCPRCGEKYLLSATLCSECDGVALELPRHRPSPSSTLA